jgi:Fe-S cluster biogenesis protein NfuA
MSTITALGEGHGDELDEGHDQLFLRVQELQEKLDSAGDPATRELAEELVFAVVQMYGAGLERIVDSLLAAGEEGRRLAVALAEEEQVAALLMIHDLHPVPLLERVQGALEQVRPYMESHGGNVELLSLEQGVARISLRGSCSSCAASTVTLELAIKQALEQAAPDLEGLEVEGMTGVATDTPTGPSLPLAGASAAPAPPPAGAIELPMAMSPSRPPGPHHYGSVELPAAISGAPARPGAETNGAKHVVPALDSAPALASEERCDLCKTTIPDDHRHLLNLVERRIECVCESCWALRSGDAEYRPTGGRTLWLPALQLPEEVWASFQIPIGLAFFMDSSTAGCVVALYPSPAGATESELHFSSWSRMVELNPILADLEPDIEALIVNRLSDPPAYAIAPIDRCYALTGTIKVNWEGLSGGPKVGEAVSGFFDELRTQALGTSALYRRRPRQPESAL